MSASPKRRARSKRRHSVLYTIVATLCVVAMVTGLGVVFTVRQLGDNISVLPSADDVLDNRPDKVVDDEAPREPLNILLIGSDKAEEGVQRSDTTILMHLSADREFAYGVSLPRDALVDRPECTDPETMDPIAGADMVMFNTAYAEGGALCTQETVETLTGVYVDAVVELDFEGFEDMVDAIGGVEICLPEPIRESRFNKELDKEGTFNATGAEALIYVRERHQLSINGDNGRMKRQQAFLAAMANKVVSAETLTSPTRVLNFLEAVTQSVTISENYSNLSSLADLAVQFNGIGLDNIQFVTVPNEEYEPDPNRLVWSDEADDLWQLIVDDQPLTAEFTQGALTAESDTGSISTGEPSTPTGSATSSPTGSATSSSTDEATDEPTDEDPVEGLTPDEVAAANGLCS